MFGLAWAYNLILMSGGHIFPVSPVIPAIESGALQALAADEGDCKLSRAS